MLLSNTTGSIILVNGGNVSIAATTGTYQVPPSLQATLASDQIVRAKVRSGALTLTISGYLITDGAEAQLWLDRIVSGLIIPQQP